MLLFLTLPALAQDPALVAGDGDSDGVTDARDRCPAEAGPRNEDPALADGCPKPAWIAGKEIAASGRVDFEPGTADLTPQSMRVLDAAGELLRGQPDLRRIEVQAHTDNAGEPDASQALTQRRAEAVVAYLVARGIEPSRLVAKGYGGTLPLFTNRTPEGRDQNRRVQLLIVEGTAREPGPVQRGLLDVRLASGSWATIEVDGKWLPRAAPLAGWPLPVGTHRLVVANPALGVRHAVEVVVEPGATTAVVVPDAPMAPQRPAAPRPAPEGGIDLDE